jgi:replication factor C subunit 2/4
MKNRLLFIAQSENCVVEDAQLDTILELAEGDMRRAVTTLQSVHALGKGVDDVTIAEIAGKPPQTVVNALYVALQTSSTFDDMKVAVEDVCLAGYSAQSLLASLLQKIINSDTLNELGRAKLAIRIAQAEKNMIDGADEYLQLMTVCALAFQCLQAAAAQAQTN